MADLQSTTCACGKPFLVILNAAGFRSSFQPRQCGNCFRETIERDYAHFVATGGAGLTVAQRVAKRKFFARYGGGIVVKPPRRGRVGITDEDAVIIRCMLAYGETEADIAAALPVPCSRAVLQRAMRRLGIKGNKVGE